MAGRGLRLRVAALLAFGLGAGHALALSGKVTHVSDGDTLWLRPADGSRRPVKVRLEGLDAPERCQAGGPQARAALESRVGGRRVFVAARARDRHDRVIGRVRLDGEDIGAWLVDHGHAWSSRFHASPGPYAVQEARARDARRGVFAQPGAVEPRRFRREHGPCD